MNDIFDAKIVCKKCDKEMQREEVNKMGLEMRTVECKSCGDKIIHPVDKQNLENYNYLKGKTFSVKLRVVGNSHAISIPKEIVNFMNSIHNDMSKDMHDMVRLCFEDFDRLSVRFNNEDYENELKPFKTQRSLNRNSKSFDNSKFSNGFGDHGGNGRIGDRRFLDR